MSPTSIGNAKFLNLGIELNLFSSNAYRPRYGNSKIE